jgi:hypothetical protein
MLKPVFDYVLGFFKKNPFFKIKVGSNIDGVTYCKTVLFKNDDGSMEIVSNETSTGTIELIFRALSSGSGGSVDVRENMFISLTSGNSINTTVSVAGNIYWVYRNGIQQLEGIDYTRSGQTFTFTTNFGILSGGIGSETVYIIYFH